MGVLILIVIVVVGLGMFIKHDSTTSEGWEIFLIKKNRHYSLRVNRPFPTPFKIAMHRGSLRFTAMFGHGCNYDSNDSNDLKGDINKLYGISYGLDDHYRSVRIGWRYNSNLKVIDLYVYSYIKGKREIKHLFSVNLFEEIHFTLFRTKNNGVIIEARPDGGTVITEAVYGIDKSIWDFKLWPYFGGNVKAPNDMTIFIK